MNRKLYILRGKCLITVSIAFILIIIGIQVQKYTDSTNNYSNVIIQDINIKDMSSPNVSVKKTNLVSLSSLEEVDMEVINNSFETLSTPKRVWYRPVEYGNISSNLSYLHTGIDITSPRGVNEVIYPIANGTISGKYTDSAGAKIVTIHHMIDNVNYTSMYVHLSSYADNLYVGREVTINDSLGHMGRTGIATGVHLHLEVADCTLFSTTDISCSELGNYFRYEKIRYTQGYRGAYNVLDLPSSWSER